MHGSLATLFLLTGFPSFFCAVPQPGGLPAELFGGNNPAIRTLNGRNLSHIECGEYDIATIQDGSEKIQIQARIGTINVTGTEQEGFTAIAVRAKNRTLEIQYKGKSSITRLLDGHSVNGFTANLSSFVASVPGAITISPQFPDKIQTVIHIAYNSYLDTVVQINHRSNVNARYTVDGLLGNKHNTSITLSSRNGTELPKNSSFEQMQSYISSWRIPSQSKSLFTYNGSRTFDGYSNNSCLTPPTTITKPPASKVPSTPSTSGHQDSLTPPNCSMKGAHKVGNMFHCDNSTVNGNGIGFCLLCDGHRDCDQGQDENRGICDCFKAEKQGCQNAASTSVLQTSIVLLSLGLGLFGRGNIS